MINRIAAGAAVAALTGAVFGIALIVFGSASKELSIGEGVASVPQAAIVAGIFGLVLGVIPATLVMTLTRARRAPWRAVPVLLLGTTVGMACTLAVAMLFRGTFADLGLLLLVAGAAVGGTLASRFVP